VDDTVHYLWRFRDEFRRHGDYRTALTATSASVGRACVFTTVVIAGGFWILLLSQFLPTAYFGGLVGFTMLGTLAADLVLLPVLITTFRIAGPAA
jgi:predicted RND superfamily exporter protein